MTSYLEVRWTFMPADFFEAQLTLTHSGYELRIEPGTIVATIEKSSLDEDPTLRASVEAYVSNMFLGVQVQTHLAFDLSRPTVMNIDADGARGHVIECEPGRAVASGSRVDLRYTREDGSIVDSRAERIQRKQWLGRLAATLAPRDDVLSRMLRSYSAAVRDPADELVHLYEIRESAVQRFGDGAHTVSQLRLGKNAWSRFGQLCNILPLTQGRHRGKSKEALRAASEDELAEARAFAATIIETYMKFAETGRK
jgi:hypothetical protein